jgi:hypothetical protein
MLSLSIGWGIRGNFGHEYGAMIAGALCGVAVCLLSGREDWRRRVLYFGVFGAMGWGFGGSMAYMLPLGYTHSGHLPSQIYGFLTTFVTGFLWASMGGAGTAYAAVEEEEKLTQVFKPICWVLVLWAVHFVVEDHLAQWYEAVQGNESLTGDFRQKDPFYWLDSDWLEACLALAALCLFDLWDRRFEKIGMLALLGSTGALLGGLVQLGLMRAGWLEPLLAMLVHPQGDPTAINPATGLPFDPGDMVSNWPQLFFDIGAHLGWIFGLVAGLTLYFWTYGKWRSGASLLLHLTLGGLLAFLIGPVLLSNVFKSVGGFRMVAPRGDNWATCVGVFVGMLVYMQRNKLPAVAFASIVTGVVGGLGLMVAQFLKILAFMPGNPALTDSLAVQQTWAHWRSTNWHSLLTEQGVGLFYGLGVVLAMGMLATRVRPHSDRPESRRWTQAFCVVLILNVIVYVNLVKNVEVWTHLHKIGFRAVPELMRPPLLDVGPFSALAWFNLIFLLIAVATVVLLAVHLRRPLAVVPTSWLGKGQLVYLLFLWTMVVGNFERALVGFAEQRLVTEGTIFVNGLIATLLILCFARDREPVPVVASDPDYGQLTRRVVVGGLAGLALLTALFTAIVHETYGDRHDGWGNRNLRVGPDADWRMHPILKSEQHR